MRFILCCLVFTIVWSTAVNGQNPRSKEGEILRSAWELTDVLSVPDGVMVHIFLDRPEKPRSMRLLLLDKDLNAIGETSFSLRRQGLDVQVEGVFYWQGQLNLLTSLYYPGPKRNHLMLEQFSLPKLEKKDAELIDEAYTPGLYRVPFGYSLSPDSSKLMCYAWSYPLPQDPARLSVVVYDSEEGKMWERSYNLPFTNETLFLQSGQVSNAGKAYLMCENYEGRVSPEMVIQEKDIRHYILALHPGSTEVKAIPLDAPDKVFVDIIHQTNVEEVIYGMAFYKSKNRRLQEGIFMTEYDMRTDQLERYLIQIRKDTYDEAYNLGDKESSFSPQRYGFESYVPGAIKVQKDGSLILYGEQYKMPTYEFSPFQYNDLLVVKVNPEFQLEWVHRIAKRQLGLPDRQDLFSYMSFEDSEGIYFLYNDHPANELASRSVRNLKIFEGRLGKSVLWQITPNGNLRYLALPESLSSYGNAGMCLPGKSWKTKEGDLLMVSNKTKQLLKLNWKNL